MELRLRLTRRRVALMAIVLGLVMAGVAYATIPDGNGVFTACKLNATGTIRLIDPSLSGVLGRCSASLETQISWNQGGPKGPVGDKGPIGDKGPSGEKGPTGDKGLAGDAGAKGPTGDKGPNGDAGAKGATGDKGPNGDAGAKGPTGDKGANGDAGTKGPTGDKGPNGDKGPQGDPGLQGSLIPHVNVEWFDLPAASDGVRGQVPCPSQSTHVLGGGVTIYSPDGHENEARLIESDWTYQPSAGWVARVRNESGRPFNGHDLKFRVSVICN